MAGWELKKGEITEYVISDERIWALFNFLFSDSSKKRNTYKFGLLKSILDNLFNGLKTEQGYYYSYSSLFSRFAENYWNLIVKYGLRQMRRDGKSEISKIESIFEAEVHINPTLSLVEFSSIDEVTKEEIIRKVLLACKKNVIGALYSDFDGVIYSFDLKGKGLTLNPCIQEFMLKYKYEIEKLNYYSWAKFLEQINRDEVLVRVIDKLELATPRRENLSIYREILRKEFEDNNCFYCGKKLGKKSHVDHFIPWSFVKDDKIWNFVLACPSCNEKKNNKVPQKEYVFKLESRNKELSLIANSVIENEFKKYSDDMIIKLWNYAKLSGLKEYLN